MASLNIRAMAYKNYQPQWLTKILISHHGLKSVIIHAIDIHSKVFTFTSTHYNL